MGPTEPPRLKVKNPKNRGSRCWEEKARILQESWEASSWSHSPKGLSWGPDTPRLPAIMLCRFSGARPQGGVLSEGGLGFKKLGLQAPAHSALGKGSARVLQWVSSPGVSTFKKEWRSFKQWPAGGWPDVESGAESDSEMHASGKGK